MHLNNCNLQNTGGGGYWSKVERAHLTIFDVAEEKKRSLFNKPAKALLVTSREAFEYGSSEERFRRVRLIHEGRCVRSFNSMDPFFKIK